jgi:hypothetical protein
MIDKAASKTVVECGRCGAKEPADQVTVYDRDAENKHIVAPCPLTFHRPDQPVCFMPRGDGLVCVGYQGHRSEGSRHLASTTGGWVEWQ